MIYKYEIIFMIGLCFFQLSFGQEMSSENKDAEIERYLALAHEAYYEAYNSESEDYSKAEEYNKKAANLGSEEAYHNLIGLYLATGRNDEAEFYLKLDAELGDLDALVQMGINQKRRGNLEEANQYFKKAISAFEVAVSRDSSSDLFDHFDAENVIDALSDFFGSYEKFKEYFIQRAQQGNVDAQFVLAKLAFYEGNIIEAKRQAILAIQGGKDIAKDFLEEIKRYKTEL